jgi:hypothetical protein
MTTQEIKTNWNNLKEKTNPLLSKDINLFGLSDQTVAFFKQCGLPSQSAPFLSFVDNSNRELDTINRISNLYELPKEFDSYINIGGDGGGNPIVINTKKNDIIELLDHEQDFAPMDFMNTNVLSLSACLIAYRTFVNTVIETNGSSAFLNADFTDRQFEALKNSLINADKESAQNGFWAMELDMLLSNRDYFKKRTKITPKPNSGLA